MERKTSMPYPTCVRDICAVITTYQPDADFSLRVERVRSQVGKVVIVDDRGNDYNLDILQNWFGELPDVTLHHNSENEGIASSLNRGVAIARSYGYDWILTLDDDSTVGLKMVERLLFYLRQTDDGSPVGLIGMSWTQSDDCEPVMNVNLDRPWMDKCYIITSGSLFSLMTFDDIGPFRDEFVIGFVDYDYCLRARAKGYRVIKVNEIGFEHVLGQPTAYRRLGRTIFVRNCSPERLYYLHRNSTILAREHFWRDPKCVCTVMLHQFRMLFKVAFFEQDKMCKMSSMWRGMLDGWHNRLGRMKPNK
jgi:rhamnosyltransferase